MKIRNRIRTNQLVISVGILFGISVFVLGCKVSTDEKAGSNTINQVEDTIQVNTDTNSLETDSLQLSNPNNEASDTLGERLKAFGLVDVQSLNERIMVDLKYATKDNFIGKNVYGNLSQAYLQPDVAKRLAKVQDYLDETNQYLRLYIFDAVRPVSVQQMMWDSLDSIPVQERVKFVSNPKNRSLHNFGAAVDLSLFDTQVDSLLDMGAGFDDPRKIAYPSLEAEFLANGELTKKQVANRKKLRNAMRQGGFWVLPTEWWHFNAYSRSQAAEKYKAVP